MTHYKHSPGFNEWVKKELLSPLRVYDPVTEEALSLEAEFSQLKNSDPPPERMSKEGRAQGLSNVCSFQGN